MRKKPPNGRPPQSRAGGGERRAALTGAPGDPLALLSELITRLDADASDAPDEHDELFAEAVHSFSQLLMDDHGGDPTARRLRATILKKFEAALADVTFDPSALLILAKIFSDSGWDVPDSLKRRLVETLDDPDIGAREVGGDLEATLNEIAQASEGDPFAAFDALNSVLAAFPAGAAGAMVGALAEGSAPVLRHVLAGFAMHREPALAHAALESLKSLARTEKVESALVERLVRMRPWLPSDRQPLLDETIRAMRAQARAPVETERPEATRCFAMACDSSGAGGLLASLKARDGWRFVAAMTRTSGVEEALSVEGLSKRESDAAVRGMRESVTAVKTDVEGLGRCLQLALGENVAAGAPPPFRLVALAESLGLGPLAPRAISPVNLIAELLDGAPEAESGSEAAARARRTDFDEALAQPWFESGEEVERLLRPLRGPKARTNALLTQYLPQRREFWTRACAMTAFILNLEPKTYGAVATRLALVGRDIADGVALESIGLMRDIAGISVAAYESRSRRPSAAARD